MAGPARLTVVTAEPAEPAASGASGALTAPSVLTVIGDLLEDIVVHTAAATADWQNATDNSARIVRRRGGSAANVAAAAGSAVPTRFIGRVGDDAVGRALVVDLAAHGVEIHVQIEGRTGAVLVVVDGTGERTMFPDRAAAAELDSISAQWLEGTAIVHIPAYGLVCDPMARSIHAAVRDARRLGSLISIDVSAASLIRTAGPEGFTSMIDAVHPDIVLANADEAALLDLERHPLADITVIKRGPDPALAWIDGRWVAVPVRDPIEAVDTTGAGDAFAAGFLAALITGTTDTAAAVIAGHRRAREILEGHRLAADG